MALELKSVAMYTYLPSRDEDVTGKTTCNVVNHPIMTSRHTYEKFGDQTPTLLNLCFARFDAAPLKMGKHYVTSINIET